MRLATLSVVAGMPGILFAATIFATRLGDGLGDLRRVRVAGMSHRLRQVGRPDEEHVDAFDLQNLIGVADRRLVLELHADQRLLVRGGGEVRHLGAETP